MRRVRELSAVSPVAGQNAAREVRRYFEWIENVLPTEAKTRLFEEIQALPGANN
jgi:hypothetical protein